MKFLGLTWPLAAVAALFVCRPVAADFLTVYGSPLYDSTTGTGYQGSGAAGFYFNGGVVETLGKYGLAPGGESRAVRWEKSGVFVELARLGTASNGQGASRVSDLNAAGIAVGASEKFISNVSKGSRAVRWDASGAVIEMGNLGAAADGRTSAGAFAVNSFGVSTGSADKYVGGVKKGQFAVRWNADGSATELGVLGGDANAIAESIARDINDSGTVVGAGYKLVNGVDQAWRAVRWDGSSTVATELGTLGTDPTGSSSYDNIARKINNAGIIIGESDKFERGFFLGIRPVRWAPGGTAATELGHLGTTVNGYTNGWTADINEAGRIVGRMTKYVNGVEKGDRAVRWNAGSTAGIELGNLGVNELGVTYAAAESINASGMIAGWADRYMPDVREHAVVWGLNGVAIDLNDFVDPASGWVQLSVAHRIDDDNWVTGAGVFDPDGPGPRQPFMRDFLMQIPEPSALMLLACVGLALGTRVRK